MGELPADGRDVRHGAYAQAERFCARVYATERNYDWMRSAVYRDAGTCVPAFQGVWTRCRADGGRSSCGYLPGRDFEQCYHVSFERRCGAFCRHDECEYLARSGFDAGDNLFAFAHDREC